MITHTFRIVLGVLIPLFHIVGILLAVHAVIYTRTSQGAIAWTISLVTFPYVAVPLYLICGRSTLSGYIEARRAGSLEIHDLAQTALSRLAPYGAQTDPSLGHLRDLYERLVRLPFTRGNRATLLINGNETFQTMLNDIRKAKAYILTEFFIVHGDRIGNIFKDALIEQARRGVRVNFLYDAIGSRGIPASYIAELRAAGIEVSAFRSTKWWRNRFQLNFRNHRKLTIIDGRTAFLGGLNVGDEYLGRSPKFGYWRDTHVRLEGPSVQCVQLAYLEDWYWVRQEILDLEWEPQLVAEDGEDVMVLPTGPADILAPCEMGFITTVFAAKDRLWICSPYFVPDPSVVVALQLAALRGVDVRIMLPDRPDHLLVYLSSFSFYEEMLDSGVKLFRFKPGFMHQKVMLVDDRLATVGTVNLDNRSFRLNFEITALVSSDTFVNEVTQVLEEDFGSCREVSMDDYLKRPLWFKAAVNAARLLAPVQ